jgi:peptidoglycan/LPS O-acetylase OafA/YrhL
VVPTPLASTPAHSPTPPASARRGIPSLDGIRAISVALVCLSHAPHVGVLPEAIDRAYAYRGFGALGVRVFFVLSGYLITTLLIRERERVGRIAFGAFYWRRSMRIFPPYYVYLAVVALLAGRLGIEPDAVWWPAWAYVSNIVNTRAWIIGHSWSLSVEEQFYLVWPAMFAAGWAWRGRRGAAWAAAILFAAGPVGRLGAFVITRSWWAATWVWQTDTLAAGCLAALLPDVSAWVAQRGKSVAAALTVVIVLQPVLSIPYGWGFVTDIALFRPVQALAMAAMIVWCAAHPDGAIGRFLNRPVLRAIGLVSYSIYLWQQVWFAPWLGARVHAGLPWPVAFTLAIAGTAACAVASYHLVERPSFALRERIAQVTRRRTARA